MKQMILDTYSMWIQKKYDYNWYEWCVFVLGTEEELAAIESIKYTLHPSFPEPVRVIKNRSNCFALFSSGWGAFTLGVEATFTDGSTSNMTHFVDLLKSWPRGAMPAAFGDDDEKSVYQSLIHEKYRWRKMSTIVSKTSLTEERVLEVLRGLEESDLARKSYIKSVDNQDMWGATAVVGITPRPSGT